MKEIDNKVEEHFFVEEMVLERLEIFSREDSHDLDEHNSKTSTGINSIKK